jgi:hypothetical protein
MFKKAQTMFAAVLTSIINKTFSFICFTNLPDELFSCDILKISLNSLHVSHRQLLRYEKDGPELYYFAQNNNILKNNLCKKMRLRALKSIQSFPIS